MMVMRGMYLLLAHLYEGVFRIVGLNLHVHLLDVIDGPLPCHGRINV